MDDVEGLIEQAQQMVREARHVVALTGAGISTPSGIPDFRSPNSGMWSQVDPFEVASIYGFRRRPQDFYDWIHPLAKLTMEARPNPAHEALAQLEAHGPLQCVITQNIDMLHRKAGSQVVHELHGHLREMTCLRCYQVSPAAEILEAFIANGEVPHCSCGGVLKPNVILFGEQLPVTVLNEARRQAKMCDLMVVAGSSLEVAPAGDLPLLAKECGARVMIVNYDRTFADEAADLVIHADVVEVLPRLAAVFT
jgi:NAD-dependent deacetylase